MKGVSPCLTKSRAGDCGYWLSWKNRLITTNEIVRLMGVWPEDIPHGIVSDRSLRKMAGNAVVVPLLARLLKQLLDAADL